jgi:hypothetical protein
MRAYSENLPFLRKKTGVRWIKGAIAALAARAAAPSYRIAAKDSR